MHTFLTSSTLRSGLRFLDRVLVTFLLCFVFGGSWGQVATGYTWSQAAGTYTAVGSAGSNALFADGWDDNQATVTLPFTFTFDEVAYTQVTISSNGFLVFGSTLNANNSGEAFVSATDASGLYLGGTGTDNGIAGFNADLDEQIFATVTGNRTSGSTSITSVSSTANLRVGMRLSGTGIPTNAVITNIAGATVTLSVAATSGTNTSTTLTPIANAVAVTTGTAPNRVFVVQYTRVTRFGNTDDASFQIRLSEGGGNLANQTVQTVYGTCTGSNNNNNGPVQVGIRSTTSDFNSRTTTSDWTATTAGAANTDRCRFRNTIAPPSGRTYTWTPGFCSGSVTAGSISGTSPICTGTGTTLTLSGMSTAAYGISTAWFYSTVNGGPYTTSAGTGNSIATGNLSATRYYVATTTCSNGPTSATTAQFAVVVNPTPTASNAGPDQTICISSVSTALAANTPTNGTGAWSIVAGSPNTSTAQLSSTTSPTATFTPTTSGVYTLTWTISNSPCTASTNDVVITVRALPTTATVGGTQTICTGSTTAALGGNTPGSGTGQWSVVSGGTGTFSNATSGSSTFTHTGGTGPVVLRWTISNSPCASSTADVTINITPATTASNAGPDQTICISSVSTALAANTPAQGTGAWSILAGSPNTSTAQLSSTTSPTATFTPTATGTYTLRWTISNSPCTASTNDVVITVRALPTTATVGGTQTICTGSTTAALGGNTPGSGTGQWSIVSGGTGTFSNSTSGSSTFTHTGGTGPVVLRWTISNSPCAASTADVTINITPATTTANAGPDQTICLSNTSTTLAANTPAQGTGAWSILAGSPNTSTAQLSSTSSPTATFTPTATGTYTLRWTISNSPCVASTNDVVITVNPFAFPVSQTFNSNGTFTVPAGVTQISVQAWGGGAAGGGSTSTGSGLTGRGGAGGGGGAFVTKTLTVTPGSTLNVQVATAVTGSSGANGSNGNPSTITGFEAQILAAGGSGGAGNTAGGTPTGGAGGSTAASQGDTETAGSSGGNGATGLGISSGAGGAGANGGGSGGSSLGSGTSNGNNGTAPGGGGGGGRTSGNNGNTTGGSGAAGRVIITYTPVPSLSASASTICEGGSSTLTASGGGTYLWSPGGATTSSIAVSPAATATYSVTITNTCPALLTQQVTVTPTPVAGSNNTLTICSNDAAADMGALLGTHDAGTWSGPSTVASDLYDPATMTPGNYVYTVVAAPCPNAVATITVTENTAVNWYADTDGDGFGSGAGTMACSAPNLGDVTNNTDQCPIDPAKQVPGQCGCGNPDTDTDSDGTADCNDGCPNDANKIAPGICGCGTSDVDTDGDLTADCNDGCPLDANKVVPGICGCGVSDVDTDLDGTADCNDGCPADPNKIAPGQCGCGNLETDTDLDGTADCVDGCPSDPDKIAPGVCGCETPDDDADGDGLADCVDPCPDDMNNSDSDSDGTPDCTDNCPLDANKVNPGTCGCGVADTDTDGDTYADCVDGCPADANKIAPGACGCGVVDADNDGDGTLNCNDGCPNDANKIAPGVCGCGTADTDTDGDSVADCNDNCPLVQGQIGSACDDGNASTINDAITNGCVCAGTSVTNLAALELTTDNDAASTSWDIIPLAGGPALCSGGGYANSSNQTLNCDLPDGCYRLRVFDANMDGLCCINGLGGYVLRTTGGQRIIDAAGAGIFSNTAEVALGFCVPIGGDHLTPSRCDREDYLPSDFIQATPNAAVQAQFNVGTQSDDGYQFWIFNPNGGYSRRVLITHATNNYLFPAGADRCSYLKLNSLTTSQIPHNMLVNVRVRSMVNGVYSEFGSACRLKIDLTNQCPTTQLLNNPSDSHHSCGLVNVPLNGSRTLYAAAVSGATTYQFEFSKPGYLRKITSPGSNLLMTQWYTMPLQNNSTYNVRVRVSFDGGANYCPFSGSCTLTTAGAPPGNQNALEDEVEGMDLSVWPNPNHGEVVTLKLAGFGDENEQEMTITVTDLFGKQVYAERTVVQGDVLNTTLDLQGYAAGIYLVNVTTADHAWTKRVIVQ